jgi:YD repeat-containing protein
MKLRIAQTVALAIFVLASNLANAYTTVHPGSIWYQDLWCNGNQHVGHFTSEPDGPWEPVRDAAFTFMNTAECFVKGSGIYVIDHYDPGECTVEPLSQGARVVCVGSIYHECTNSFFCGESWTQYNWKTYIYKACGDGYKFELGDQLCHCRYNTTQLFYPPAAKCVSYGDKYFPPSSCPAEGNPILPLAGAKVQKENGTNLAGASLLLAYNSTGQIATPESEFIGKDDPKPFGELWGSNLHKDIKRLGLRRSMVLRRGVEHETFGYVGESYVPTRPESGLELKKLSVGFRLLDRNGGLVEDYTPYTLPDVSAATDLLRLSSQADGRKLTYEYSTGEVDGVSPEEGLLIAITDSFGRRTRFFYERNEHLASSRVYKIIGPDDQEIKVGYDAKNNLSVLTWPDLKQKTFLYALPDWAHALTGIVDEEGTAYAQFGYENGRAISTEHAGAVSRYAATWGMPPSPIIVETFDDQLGVIWREHRWSLPQGTQIDGPNGTRTLSATLVNGVARQSGSSQPGGSGCGASSSEQTYDGRGNTLSRLDFGESGTNRRRTCYAYAADRSVETYRVEGMMETDACPADLAAYQVPGNLPADKPQRKVSTEWHPLWKLETRRAEPKRITTTIYNGQKDPPETGSVVNCVDTSPTLPDGSLIAVVCRRYEQSTSDETGNLGFTAPVIETRQWNYTYNQYGQVLTETDPRNKTTSYGYWGLADTSFTGEGNAARGHWFGDLKTVTNAKGQVTQYLEYNKRGQVLTIQQPNNSLELREYHVRGWPTKVTLRPAGAVDALKDQVTLYDYYATGLLKTVTQPDGSVATYTYDGAHRLREVKDSLGNKVTYTLDNAGNRTNEEFTDSAGVLAKTISRTFDALGRLSKATGMQ